MNKQILVLAVDSDAMKLYYIKKTMCNYLNLRVRINSNKKYELQLVYEVRMLVVSK